LWLSGNGLTPDFAASEAAVMTIRWWLKKRQLQSVSSLSRPQQIIGAGAASRGFTGPNLLRPAETASLPIFLSGEYFARPVN